MKELEIYKKALELAVQNEEIIERYLQKAKGILDYSFLLSETEKNHLSGVLNSLINAQNTRKDKYIAISFHIFPVPHNRFYRFNKNKELVYDTIADVYCFNQKMEIDKKYNIDELLGWWVWTGKKNTKA